MPSYPYDVNDTVVYDGADLYLPKDCSLTIFEDSRLFLFGEVYLNGLPILTGSGVTSGSEVQVGPTAPVDPGITLWFDTSSGYGELKVKVAGSWKTVEDPTDSELSNEIYVGGVEPVGSNYELWVDTASNAPSLGTAYTATGNAIGIVARGTFKPNPVNIPQNSTIDITDTVTVTTAFGRRYRFVGQIRATGVTPAGSFTTVFHVDGAGLPGGINTYVAGNWNYVRHEHIWDGDGLTHTIKWVVGTGGGIAVAAYTDNGIFYIEDVGPNSSPPLPVPETPPAWTPVTVFQNSWVNYGGAQDAQYRKVGDIVEIRGLIKSGTVSSGVPAFTLPVGFRPPWSVNFPVSAFSLFGVVQVTSAGLVCVSVGNNSFVALDPIKFSVAP